MMPARTGPHFHNKIKQLTDNFCSKCFASMPSFTVHVVQCLNSS